MVSQGTQLQAEGGSGDNQRDRVNIWLLIFYIKQQYQHMLLNTNSFNLCAQRMQRGYSVQVAKRQSGAMWKKKFLAFLDWVGFCLQNLSSLNVITVSVSTAAPIFLTFIIQSRNIQSSNLFGAKGGQAEAVKSFRVKLSPCCDQVTRDQAQRVLQFCRNK